MYLQFCDMINIYMKYKEVDISYIYQLYIVLKLLFNNNLRKVI